MLDRPDRQDPSARLDLKETEASPVLLERADSLDLKDHLDSTANPERKVLLANAAPTDCRARTAHQDRKALRARLDPPVLLDQLVWPVLLDATDSPALRDFRDPRANLALLEWLLR